jgi:glycosyltransferase involved in cell wall biosynthesis
MGGMVRGGAETLVMHMLRGIDRGRYRIDILTHTDRPCPYDDEVRWLGCRLIPCLGHHNPWVYARNFRRAARANGPYDVVHSHMFYFNGLVMFLASRLGIPVRISHIYPIQDVKDMAGTSLPRRLYRNVATGLILKYSTHIVADSQSALDSFQRLGRHDPAKERVIYPGIDLAPFARTVDRDAVRRSLSLPPDRPLISYVARFMPHKNHAQALRVANLLDREGTRFHFALAGTHGSCLDDLARATSGRDDVSLLIGLEDISGLLLASDLFFFPSLEEGFGVVAVEAAAAGLPIVATDLPTIREASPPGHHRFMFSPNDDRAAAAHIATILDDPRLRADLSEEARRWAPAHSTEAMIEHLLDLYGDAAPCTRPRLAF